MMKLLLLISLSFFCQALQAQGFGSTYISEVGFYDRGTLGSSPDLAIDLVKGSCGFKDQNGDGDTTDAGDLDPEDFYDTLVSLKIKNPNAVPVYISKLSYRLPNAQGKLKSWMGGLSPVSGGLIPAKGEATVSFFIFRANATGKTTFRPASALSSTLGFQDIVLRLDAKSSSGRLSRITAKRGLSFGNEDRCSSS